VLVYEAALRRWLSQSMRRLLALGHNKRIAALFDSIAILAAFGFAMLLRLDNFQFEYWSKAYAVVAWLAVGMPFVFRAVGLYRIWVRFTNARALISIAQCAALVVIALFLLHLIFSFPVPRSVFIIFFVMLLLLMAGGRVAFRLIYEVEDGRSAERVLIYGAGVSGRQLAAAMKHQNTQTLVGFLDDDADKLGTELLGVRVYAPRNIKKIIAKTRADTVLLAMPQLSGKNRRDIVVQLEAAKIQVKTIPDLNELMSGRANLFDIDSVSEEDIIEREPVTSHAHLLQQNIAGHSVMVTGAGGSIGSELCRQIIANKPARLVMFDVSELALYHIQQEFSGRSDTDPIEMVYCLGSVQNRNLVQKIIEKNAVQTLYHAAAYKHVPISETNIGASVLNNILGTQNVVAAAISGKVERLVMISTDKAVRPTNIMGATKRLAEWICQSAATVQNQTVVSMVRFGNVLGSSGSVVPLFRRQVESGGPVTVTHPEVTRFFMTVAEAAQLVIQAGAMAKGGEVFLLDMGKPIRILELAERIIRLHGFEPLHIGAAEDEVPAGSIGIVFTGLREGEKLYEELLVDATAMATDHPQIRKANEIIVPRETARQTIADILDAARIQDDATVRDIFLNAGIGYQPNGHH
jgi:FlaA1/EpsC-like NDP-sugar epimerase